MHSSQPPIDSVSNGFSPFSSLSGRQRDVWRWSLCVSNWALGTDSFDRKLFPSPRTQICITDPMCFFMFLSAHVVASAHNAQHAHACYIFIWGYPQHSKDIPFFWKRKGRSWDTWDKYRVVLSTPHTSAKGQQYWNYHLKFNQASPTCTHSKYQFPKYPYFVHIHLLH